ncbi:MULTISPECIES: hypothetical protein [Streptomyces]|uniref:Uncharacterized protein n=1 Tax=Streptomyces griseiscabiei TaxID=2993540 RepID=A0ABU4LE81_9ACTN|nr:MULTISPECIES: hypothetical protein [Streptomyces]MDX2914044.1 hypothetical protein [Streptomyces griseiscabiei]
MLMNRIETAAVNSPARRALQRFYEVPALMKLAGGPLAPERGRSRLAAVPGSARG